MPSHTLNSKKPLTPLILAALQHLAGRNDQALVRFLSNYWIAESDEKTNPLSREMRDFDERFLASGSFLEAHQQPLLVFRTPTVNAMISRGLLKFTGPKRIFGVARNKKEYLRAALTSEASEVCREMAEKSLATYKEVLHRIS